MQFIEALKLRNKLFFLFILITMGLISVGVIGSMHLNTMKKNIDKLYFGSLVPVTELNEIIQIYHNGLANSVYKASRLEISPSQTSLEIQHAIKEIRKKWKSYESHFKRDEELDYIGYTTLEIQHTNEYFLKIYKVAKEGKDLTRIKLSILEKKVSYIHNVIQKLIKYEVDVAHYDYTELRVHKKTTWNCSLFYYFGYFTHFYACF